VTFEEHGRITEVLYTYNTILRIDKVISNINIGFKKVTLELFPLIEEKLPLYDCYLKK